MCRCFPFCLKILRSLVSCTIRVQSLRFHLVGCGFSKSHIWIGSWVPDVGPKLSPASWIPLFHIIGMTAKNPYGFFVLFKTSFQALRCHQFYYVTLITKQMFCQQKMKLLIKNLRSSKNEFNKKL